MLNPPGLGRTVILDVAGGTGDVAFRIIEAAGRERDGDGCDISPEMLAVGRSAR